MVSKTAALEIYFSTVRTLILLNNNVETKIESDGEIKTLLTN